MEIQYNIRVYGKVQGVWFRKSTLDKANSLDIKGIVKNELDGSVFIVARGESEKLNEFIAFCRSGPPDAEVNHIHVEEEECGDYADFKII